MKSFENEILVKMATNLGFEKTAGAAAFKQELETAKSKADCDAVYAKHRAALKQEPTQEDWEAMVNSKKSKLSSADDVVISASLETLSKIADMFDNNGLEAYANYIDDVITRIALGRMPGGYEGGLTGPGQNDKQYKEHFLGGLDDVNKLLGLLKSKFNISATQEDVAKSLENLEVKRHIRAQGLDAAFGQLKQEFNSAITSQNFDEIKRVVPNIIAMLSAGDKQAPEAPVSTGKGSGNDLIKKVQKMLGVKTDGVWGPKTAGAWNRYMKTLDETWAKMGVNPNGKQAPSPETMNSVLMGAGKRQEKTVAPGVAKPVEYGEGTMPWPGDQPASKKPAQETDTESPNETPRQKELRQQYEKMTGGKQI